MNSQKILHLESGREAEIDKIIHSVIDNNNEDAIQDAWLKVLEQLEQKALTDTQITELAKEAKENNRKAHNQTAFTERSLSEPIGKDKEDDLTLETILPDTYVDEQPKGADAPTKFQGHRPYKNVVGIDLDTAKILRTRYPNHPLIDAIRLAVGLQPLNRSRAWQEWEDNIIKEYYPNGGSWACRADLSHRSRQIINQRARSLGINLKTKIIRGHESWLTVPEVATILGCHKAYIFKLVRDKILDVIPMNFGKQQHFRFTEQMVAKFIKEYPFKYRHENLNGFSKYAPEWLLNWIPISVAAKTVHLSLGTISSYARNKAIPMKYGVKNSVYVQINDIQNFLASKQPQSTKQPFKVAQYDTKSHCIINVEKIKMDSGYHIIGYKYCQPDSKYIALVTKSPLYKINYKAKLLRGYPTCSKCLSALNKFRKEVS